MRYYKWCYKSLRDTATHYESFNYGPQLSASQIIAMEKKEWKLSCEFPNLISMCWVLGKFISWWFFRCCSFYCWMVIIHVIIHVETWINILRKIYFIHALHKILHFFGYKCLKLYHFKSILRLRLFPQTLLLLLALHKKWSFPSDFFSRFTRFQISCLSVFF